ncbi:MAG: hypothetical protein KDB00_22070 [Planctomycetales bacterium]|nr:hypothetical protein [Planctomycetales bacterium]
MSRSFGIFVAIVALSMAGSQCVIAENDVASTDAPITVRVMVLNFDPLVGPQHQPLHKECGWFDPRKLSQNYLDDVNESSGGVVQYEIVQWRDIDGFPVKKDGFCYSADSYLACRSGRQDWHRPDLADYPKLVDEFEVTQAIDDNKVDELWIFGGPYFGFHESAMMGPRAFYINGGVYDHVPSKRTYVVMGFNYERGAAEMLHNLCHRTESTMSHVYGGWKSEELTTNWAKFAANLKQSGVAAVGSCHYPPNAETDYDYSNPREVESSAEDWSGFPKLTGRTSMISCETWGGPDYHRNYMKWWFSHLPRAPGTNSEDGKLNNWYKYVFAPF